MIDGRKRDGFALPSAIFVIAFVTISLTAAFALISSERRVLDNTTAQVDAFSIAQSGLELFLVNRASMGFAAAPPAVYESTRVNLSHGYADVVLQRIRPSVAGEDPLYVVRSHGVKTAPSFARTPLARRVTAQYVRWQEGEMDVRAGWMSLTGLHKNGNAGTISGADQCGVGPDVAGVSVPDPPGFSASGPFSPTGNPPIEHLGPASQAADSVHIDWAGIVDGTAFTPDVAIPPASWPSFADPNYWPTIVVAGDLALTPGMSGRGILIVTANLTMNGSASWDGIILVGERLTSNGNNRVDGATLTGLDVLLAADPDSAANAIGQTSIGNGNKRYRYNSCNVLQALAGFGGLRAYPNAWTDNWPAY